MGNILHNLVTPSLMDHVLKLLSSPIQAIFLSIKSLPTVTSESWRASNGAKQLETSQCDPINLQECCS